MLELDQERLDAVVASSLAFVSSTPITELGALVKKDGYDDADTPPLSSFPSLPYALASQPGYGADFASGASAAEAVGSLVVLGDAKARSLPDELRRRLFEASVGELADVPRILRSLAYITRALGVGAAPRMAGSGGGGGGGAVSTPGGELLGAQEGWARVISFPAALAADRGKTIPLQAPAALAALAVMGTIHDAVYSGGTAGGDGFGAAGVAGVAGLAGMAAVAGVPGGMLEAAASAADAALSMGAVLAFSRAVEVLIVERDDVLARSAARAASLSAALRRGELWRVSHEFTADPAATAAAAVAAATKEGIAAATTDGNGDIFRASSGNDDTSFSSSHSPLSASAPASSLPRPSTVGVGTGSLSAAATVLSDVPCFTLRRRLGAGEERRLNLFEPRWLALMDRLAIENGGQLEGAELGCMLGVNRRYVSSEWLSRARTWKHDGKRTSNTASTGEAEAGAGVISEGKCEGTAVDLETGGGRDGGGGGGGFGGTRSADLVVEPWLRMARVVRVTEGRRAVTGARKLEVWIEGAPDVIPEVTCLRPHPAGYLVAQVDKRSYGQTVRGGGENWRGSNREGDGSHSMLSGSRVRAAVSQRVDGAAAAARPVRCVCVVGLAHCNGVVARLSSMELDGW
jgi:hypothetical protein